MTHNNPSKLHVASAAVAAGLGTVQLRLSRLDLGPYLNQARSVPWGGVAMAIGSGLQRLMS